MQTHRLDGSYWALRVTYTVVPLVAGLDKFFHLLTDWTRYLAPPIARLLPMSPGAFMMVVGVIEIVAGVLMLTAIRRWGALIVMAWLVGIALNLILAGYFDIAVRDLAMAVGAFALSQLEAARVQPQETMVSGRGFSPPPKRKPAPDVVAPAP